MIKMINNYEVFEVLEDKTVDKDYLTSFYYDLDMSFIRFLENHDLFQQILDYASFLSRLKLLPEGVSFTDIADCL